MSLLGTKHLLDQAEQKLPSAYSFMVVANIWCTLRAVAAVGDGATPVNSRPAFLNFHPSRDTLNTRLNRASKGGREQEVCGCCPF